MHGFRQMRGARTRFCLDLHGAHVSRALEYQVQMMVGAVFPFPIMLDDRCSVYMWWCNSEMQRYDGDTHTHTTSYSSTIHTHILLSLLWAFFLGLTVVCLRHCVCVCRDVCVCSLCDGPKGTKPMPCLGTVRNTGHIHRQIDTRRQMYRQIDSRQRNRLDGFLSRQI